MLPRISFLENGKIGIQESGSLAVRLSRPEVCLPAISGGNKRGVLFLCAMRLFFCGVSGSQKEIEEL